jgi:hypothetical protein
LSRDSLLDAKLTVGGLADMLKTSVASTVSDSVFNALPLARRSTSYRMHDKVRFFAGWERREKVLVVDIDYSASIALQACGKPGL